MLCRDKVNTFLTTFCFQSITNINIYYNYKQCCFWSGIALFSEGSMNRSKVAIIGAGNVGSTTAFCMINQGICDEIVLIDINHEKAYGEVLDLQHSMEYMGRNCKVSAGDYSQCRDADIIVITASAPMSKDLNDRRVLLGATKKILKSIEENYSISLIDNINLQLVRVKVLNKLKESNLVNENFKDIKPCA